LQPADITPLEADPRVIRNKAKIEASVENAKELLAILRTHGTTGAISGRSPTPAPPPATCTAGSGSSATRASGAC